LTPEISKALMTTRS